MKIRLFSLLIFIGLLGGVVQGSEVDPLHDLPPLVEDWEQAPVIPPLEITVVVSPTVAITQDPQLIKLINATQETLSKELGIPVQISVGHYEEASDTFEVHITTTYKSVDSEQYPYNRPLSEITEIIEKHSEKLYYSINKAHYTAIADKMSLDYDRLYKPSITTREVPEKQTSQEKLILEQWYTAKYAKFDLDDLLNESVPESMNCTTEPLHGKLLNLLSMKAARPTKITYRCSMSEALMPETEFDNTLHLDFSFLSNIALPDATIKSAVDKAVLDYALATCARKVTVAINNQKKGVAGFALDIKGSHTGSNINSSIFQDVIDKAAHTHLTKFSACTMRNFETALQLALNIPSVMIYISQKFDKQVSLKTQPTTTGIDFSCSLAYQPKRYTIHNKQKSTVLASLTMGPLFRRLMSALPHVHMHNLKTAESAPTSALVAAPTASTSAFAARPDAGDEKGNS